MAAFRWAPAKSQQKSGLDPDAAVLEHAPGPTVTTQTLLQNTKTLTGQGLPPAEAQNWPIFPGQLNDSEQRAPSFSPLKIRQPLLYSL